MKKELDSYKANKPWREALPLPDDNKNSEKKADENKADKGKSDDTKAKKKGESAEEKVPQKSE